MPFSLAAIRQIGGAVRRPSMVEFGLFRGNVPNELRPEGIQLLLQTHGLPSRRHRWAYLEQTT
jgi:hypothetical protein